MKRTEGKGKEKEIEKEMEVTTRHTVKNSPSRRKNYDELMILSAKKVYELQQKNPIEPLKVKNGEEKAKFVDLFEQQGVSKESDLKFLRIFFLKNSIFLILPEKKALKVIETKFIPNFDPKKPLSEFKNAQHLIPYEEGQFSQLQNSKIVHALEDSIYFFFQDEQTKNLGAFFLDLVEMNLIRLFHDFALPGGTMAPWNVIPCPKQKEVIFLLISGSSPMVTLYKPKSGFGRKSMAINFNAETCYRWNSFATAFFFDDKLYLPHFSNKTIFEIGFRKEDMIPIAKAYVMIDTPDSLQQMEADSLYLHVLENKIYFFEKDRVRDEIKTLDMKSWKWDSVETSPSRHISSHFGHLDFHGENNSVFFYRLNPGTQFGFQRNRRIRPSPGFPFDQISIVKIQLGISEPVIMKDEAKDEGSNLIRFLKSCFGDSHCDAAIGRGDGEVFFVHIHLFRTLFPDYRQLFFVGEEGEFEENPNFLMRIEDLCVPRSLELFVRLVYQIEDNLEDFKPEVLVSVYRFLLKTPLQNTALLLAKKIANFKDLPIPLLLDVLHETPKPKRKSVFSETEKLINKKLKMGNLQDHVIQKHWEIIKEIIKPEH